MNGADRTYLNVAYRQREAAKLDGAKWDVQRQLWYAPDGLQAQLQRWMFPPASDEALPGEDRTFAGDSKLYVDLIPGGSWTTNLRSWLGADRWKAISRMVRERSGGWCEACGRLTPLADLDAHERFAFDEVQGVQRLVRLVALCDRCHLATHYGFARTQGKEQAAIEQLQRVNGWSGEQVRRHVAAAMQLWRDRDDREWIVDLSLLTAHAGDTAAMLQIARRVTLDVDELARAVPALMRLEAVIVHPSPHAKLRDRCMREGDVPTGLLVVVGDAYLNVIADQGCVPDGVQGRVAFVR